MLTWNLEFCLLHDDAITLSTVLRPPSPKPPTSSTKPSSLEEPIKKLPQETLSLYCVQNIKSLIHDIPGASGVVLVDVSQGSKLKSTGVQVEISGEIWIELTYKESKGWAIKSELVKCFKGSW